MTLENSAGWVAIIGAVFLGIGQVVTIIQVWTTKRHMTGKLDTVAEQANGLSEKLVAVTARASFQEGVDAQKATQNAAEGKARRANDQPKEEP